MMLSLGSQQVFVVAQQLKFGFELHAFEDKAHFQAWAKAHPTRGMLPISAARGRPVSRSPIDHRFDLDRYQYEAGS